LQIKTQGDANTKVEILAMHNSFTSEAFESDEYSSGSYPQNRHETHYSWGEEELLVNHRNPYFFNGTYRITVRCQLGYLCTGLYNLTVNEVNPTSKTLDVAKLVSGAENNLDWSEICVEDAAGGMNFSLSIPTSAGSLRGFISREPPRGWSLGSIYELDKTHQPQQNFSVYHEIVYEPSNTGSMTRLVSRNSIVKKDTTSKLSMMTWKSMNLFQNGDENALREGDFRELCGGSPGFRPGIYYIGYYFYCNPLYSYKLDTQTLELDNRYCMEGRKDCYDGAYLGVTLTGLVYCPGASKFPCMGNQYFGLFQSLEAAIEFCEKFEDCKVIIQYIADLCTPTTCGYSPRTGTVFQAATSSVRASWRKQKCTPYIVQATPSQEICSVDLYPDIVGIQEMSVSGQSYDGVKSLFRVKPGSPCVDIKLSLIPVYGDPDISVSNLQVVPELPDLAWFNNSVGSGTLVVRHSDYSYDASEEFHVVVQCETGRTCQSKFILKLELIERGGVNVSDVVARSYALNGYSGVKWTPICLGKVRDHGMPKGLNVSIKFGSVSAHRRILVATHSPQVMAPYADWTFPTFSRSSTSDEIFLSINPGSPGLENKVLYLGVFNEGLTSSPNPNPNSNHKHDPKLKPIVRHDHSSFGEFSVLQHLFYRYHLSQRQKQLQARFKHLGPQCWRSLLLDSYYFE